MSVRYEEGGMLNVVGCRGGGRRDTRECESAIVAGGGEKDVGGSWGEGDGY